MTTFFSKDHICKAAKRKGPSGPRRQVTDTYKAQSALAKRMGSAVSVNLFKGITSFKKKISTNALSSAWASGDYGKVMAGIPWDNLPSDLQDGLDGLSQTTSEAAALQIRKLPPNINKNLRFDMSNPSIREFVKAAGHRVILNVRADAQETISREIARSFTEARTPRAVAESIRGSIGLLPSHVIALEKYRNGLVETGISETQVEKLSKLYEERLLTYRTEMIAKTETRLAVNHGQLSIWDEGVKQGFIDRATAEKEWITDGDPCDICDPMDGIRVGLYDSWQLNNGDSVNNPTESHPHCMCGVELHFGETINESE